MSNQINILESHTSSIPGVWDSACGSNWGAIPELRERSATTAQTGTDSRGPARVGEFRRIVRTKLGLSCPQLPVSQSAGAL
jgi:hypothetical protein